MSTELDLRNHRRMPDSVTVDLSSPSAFDLIERTARALYEMSAFNNGSAGFKDAPSWEDCDDRIQSSWRAIARNAYVGYATPVGSTTIKSEDVRPPTSEDAPSRPMAIHDELIGKNYLIRCVTYHQVGTIVRADDEFLILNNASWVVDSGDYRNALVFGLHNAETAFVGDGYIIARSAIVDMAPYLGPLPSRHDPL